MRFIRGHALMHVLLLVDSFTDVIHNYLALVSSALLGVGWIGGFSSNTFTPSAFALWCGWHMSIGFVFIYNMYSKSMTLIPNQNELMMMLTLK